jgi:threonine/homoserine/homoserine lactone efflux protein
VKTNFITQACTNYQPLFTILLVTISLVKISNKMEITYLLKGLLIGFSIAAPVGPIGILCIKRTLSSGRLVGLVSGLGAASADALYGCVAAFGLTFIANFLINQQLWLRLVGGLFLCYLGAKTFISKPSGEDGQSQQLTVMGAYSSTFFLTLTNPLTILAFAAVFAGLDLVEGGINYASAAVIVLGVFLGSATWWFILSGITSLLRERISVNGLRWVNRISGLIILGFGIVALLTVLF